MRTKIGLFVFLIAGIAGAMIRTFPLSDMVKESDVIMIAEVVLKTELPVESGEWPRLHHMLQPKDILKGQIPLDQRIAFDTFGSLDEDVYIEDTPQVPARGRQAVFFLSHDTNGEWYAVNAIQGVWPIDSITGEFLGMGTGTTRDQVVAAVRDAQAFAELDAEVARYEAFKRGESPAVAEKDATNGGKQTDYKRFTASQAFAELDAEVAEFEAFKKQQKEGAEGEAATHGTDETTLQIARAVLKFRLDAQKDYAAAVERFADFPARRSFGEFDDDLWPTAKPALGWSYFFETSLVCFGKLTRSGELVVGYYHPWSEVFLVTVWKCDFNKDARILDAEVLMGDFFAKSGEPPFDASRYWLRQDAFRPVLVGVSAAMHLRLFEALFRDNTNIVSNWRDAIPALENQSLLEENRYGAGVMILSSLRELVDASSVDPQDEASSAYRAALLRFRQGVQSGSVKALVDEANATLPETKEALAALPVDTWNKFRIVSYLPGPSTCLVMLSRTDNADQYLSLLFRRKGREAGLERMDFLSFQAFYAETKIGKVGLRNPTGNIP